MRFANMNQAIAMADAQSVEKPYTLLSTTKDIDETLSTPVFTLKKSVSELDN